MYCVCVVLLGAVLVVCFCRVYKCRKMSSVDGSIFFSREAYETFSYSHFESFAHILNPSRAPRTAFQAVPVSGIATTTSVIGCQEVPQVQTLGPKIVRQPETPVPPCVLDQDHDDSLVSSPTSCPESSAPPFHSKASGEKNINKKAKNLRNRKNKKNVTKDLKIETEKLKVLEAKRLKFSKLSAKEHASYLFLKSKVAALSRSEPNEEMTELMRIFRSLDAKVKKEQNELFHWQEKQTIEYVLPVTTMNYVKTMLAYQVNRINDYPRYYVVRDQIPVIGQDPKGSAVVFQYLHSPLLMGKVQYLVLPKCKASCVTLRCDPLRYPPEPSDEDKNSCALCKTVVSKDPNAELLALKHGVHVVVSSGSLSTMFATHQLCLDTAWEIPVIVKEHSQVDGRITKVVYIDKPLRKLSQPVLHQNHLFHKRALKSSLQRPLCKSSLVFGPPPHAPTGDGNVAPSLLDVSRPETLGCCSESLVTGPGKKGIGNRGTSNNHGGGTAMKERGITCDRSIANTSSTDRTSHEPEDTGTTGDQFTSVMTGNNHPVIGHDAGNLPLVETPDSSKPDESVVGKVTVLSASAGPVERVTEGPTTQLRLMRRPSFNSCSELSDDSMSGNLQIDLAADSASPCRASHGSDSSTGGSSRRSLRRSTYAETRLRARSRSSEADDEPHLSRDCFEVGVCRSPTPQNRPGSVADGVCQVGSDDVGTKLSSIDDPTGRTDPLPLSLADDSSRAEQDHAPAQSFDFKLPALGSNVCYHLWTLGHLKLLVRGSVDGLTFTGKGRTKKVAFNNISPKLEYNPKLGGECLSFIECATQWMAATLLPKGKLARVRINAFNSSVIGVEHLDASKVVPSYSQFRPAECLRILSRITEKAYMLPVGKYLFIHEAGGGAVKILNAIDPEIRKTCDNVFDLHLDHRLMDKQQFTNSVIVPTTAIDPEVHVFGRERVIPGLFLPKGVQF